MDLRLSMLLVFVVTFPPYLTMEANSSGIWNPPFFRDTNIELKNMGALELKCDNANCVKKLGIAYKGGNVETFFTVRKYKFDRSIADSGMMIFYAGDLVSFSSHIFIGMSISCSAEPAIYTFEINNKIRGEFARINAKRLLNIVEVEDCAKNVKSLWAWLLPTVRKLN